MTVGGIVVVVVVCIFERGIGGVELAELDVADGMYVWLFVNAVAGCRLMMGLFDGRGETVISIISGIFSSTVRTQLSCG